MLQPPINSGTLPICHIVAVLNLYFAVLIRNSRGLSLYSVAVVFVSGEHHSVLLQRHAGFGFKFWAMYRYFQPFFRAATCHHHFPWRPNALLLSKLSMYSIQNFTANVFFIMSGGCFLLFAVLCQSVYFLPIFPPLTYNL